MRREKSIFVVTRHTFPWLKKTIKWQIQICVNESKLSGIRRTKYAISIPRTSDSREIRPKGEQVATLKNTSSWLIFLHCLIDKRFCFSIFALLFFFAFSRYGYIHLEKRAECHESETKCMSSTDTIPLD